MDAIYSAADKKIFYADPDTLTDRKLERREVIRRGTNNVCTALQTHWQYCLTRDEMHAGHEEYREWWNSQNQSDPDFATATDEEGKLLNPLREWKEPTMAEAKRYRREKEDRQRDAAHHVRVAIEHLQAAADIASDPDLIPMETRDAAGCQERIHWVIATFEKYGAKDED